MGLEIQTVNQIKKKCEAMGWGVEKTHGDAMRSGEPDLRILVPLKIGESSYFGISVVIEVKQHGKRPTPIQFEILRRHAAKGAIAFWTNNPDEVVDIIDTEIRVRLRGAGETILRDFRPIPPPKENLVGKYSKNGHGPVLPEFD